MELTRTQLIQKIYEEKERQRTLRREERNVIARNKYLQMQPMISQEGGLKANLQRVIPTHLMPVNLGELDEIMQPYHFRVSFDFGTDPQWTPTTNLKDTFQVSQNMGFLMVAISRSWKSSEWAGYKAPLKIDYIRDAQTTRQFNNNNPIMLNNIGYRGKPTMMDIPIYFTPNSVVEVSLSSFVNENWNTTGNGYQELMIEGYQIHEKNVEAVLNAIYL